MMIEEMSKRLDGSPNNMNYASGFVYIKRLSLILPRLKAMKRLLEIFKYFLPF